jgi:hypothetical protein
LPQPPQKKQLLALLKSFFFFVDFCHVFGHFVTRGVQKHDEKQLKKIHLGSSQKMWLFSLHFFSPSVVLFDFFNHVFGRFVTRGVQKRDENSRKFSRSRQKSTYLRHIFFPRRPLKGSSKTPQELLWGKPMSKTSFKKMGGGG